MKISFSLCIMALTSAPVWAQAPVPAPAPSTLPVRQVTMFTSGVAYTERAGQVEGNAALPLLFRTAQINDILKSLVLIDQRGQVQPATYAARDPVSHTLQSFAIDVTQNLSQQEILSRLRGAQVVVQIIGNPPISGQIVGVEDRQVAGADGKPVSAAFLNLLGENGLASVRLDSDVNVRLADARLNQEFRDALTLLAASADEQRRQVTLHFAGQGRREVRVGYVMEAPLWKMSYRLLLDGAGAKDGAKTGAAIPTGKPNAAVGAGKPYLQGWALVENTSDDDWQNVRLSLVSGRPVSFIQDLYQPLYLPRPVVANDIVASPYPQAHEENLADDRPAAVIAPAPVPGGFSGGGAGGLPGSGGFGRARRKMDDAGSANRAPQGPRGDAGPAGSDAASDSLTESERIKQSVTGMASGSKAGELFQYSIATPVTLPRQQSAMIPVIARDIEAEKILLFNADSGIRFPLNAVRVRNNTTLHLKGGPVTLFDAGVYAGDARMEDVPPGDTRLLSYAVDLSVEGERQGPAISSVETAFNLKRGVLTIARRERVETTYTLKSKADKARTVLIEHPFQSEYKLIAPAQATERTAGLYRFAVPVAPGKSQTLKVAVERPLSQTVGVFDGDLNLLITYASRKEVSAKLRAVLSEIAQRRRRVQDLQAQVQARANDEKAIADDQDRIRKNMMALDHTDALYKRYASELDAQETRIKTLREEAVRLRGQAEAAERDLRVYIDNLPPVE